MHLYVKKMLHSYLELDAIFMDFSKKKIFCNPKVFHNYPLALLKHQLGYK